MTWYPDVHESFRSRWAEHGIQDGYRPPIREEMTLRIMRMGVLAEIEIRCSAVHETELISS